MSNETAAYDFVTINKLDFKKVGSKFKVNIEGNVYKAEVTRITKYDDAIVYTATFKEGGYIILNEDEYGFTGSINLPNNESFELAPTSTSTHLLTKINTINREKNINGDKDWTFESVDSERALAVTSGDQPYMDVLVAYTTAAKNWYINIDGLINMAIATTQLIYDNSGIDLIISKRSTPELTVNYFIESGSLHTDTDNFRDCQYVANLRDQVKADICVLIVSGSTDLKAGWANIIPASSKHEAYCVVRGDRLGSTYTFAHEIGHLQGLRHQYPNSERACSFCDKEIEPCLDGHGYSVEGRFRTVMAPWCTSHNAPYLRIPRFSNPLPLYSFTEDPLLPAIITCYFYWG